MTRWLPYAAAVALIVVAIGHHRRSVPAADAFSAQAPAPAAGGHVHWGYAGAEGPEHWGELAPEFSTCAQGHYQTPIDIRDAVDAELPPLAIDYRTRAVGIVDNGHSIQVNVAPGSTLTLNGRVYELKQFHFHTPSENDVNEESFAMEAHLVHADRDGRLLVLAVLYRLGAEDPAIAKIWKESPETEGARVSLPYPVDPNELLPESRDYYAFSGSLTTPPCTEGVTWIVLKAPRTVSGGEVAYLEHAVHGHNNRPLQPLHARAILR